MQLSETERKTQHTHPVVLTCCVLVVVVVVSPVARGFSSAAAARSRNCWPRIETNRFDEHNWLLCVPILDCCIASLAIL